MLKTTLALAFSLLCLGAVSAQAPLLISRIAINQTQIAFTYAGKIWLVDRKGGAAKRLTDAPNDETNPIFSPDGRQLAFSRLNGGDWDIFVVAADGSGPARRITMMPEDDFVTGWTPDGKELIFETTRDEEGVIRLYRISAEREQLATPLPLPQSFQGSVSPDGTKIAFNPRGGAGDWRYYRGGFTAPLWIADLRTGALEKLPNQNFTDRSPIWLGDKIYFLSDRTGIFNLFVYDLKTKQAKPLTTFTGLGVRAASVTNGAACFVQNGRIQVLDLVTGRVETVNVTVSPDTSELRTKNVNAMRFLEQIMPSNNGEKVVFGARGDILFFNVADGNYRNLTNTSGVAERYPVISPDNRSVAYFSDESGEYQLHIRLLENNSVKKIAVEPKPSFYTGLAWSPDSKKLVFASRTLDLWLADAEAGTVTKLDTSPYSAQFDWTPSFSPDSRFLAYQKRMQNRTGTIFIYDLTAKKSYQVTDGITHTQLPAFDANGKYLYFASSMNAGSTEFDWAVLNSVMANPMLIRRIHALRLTKDTPLPLLPNGRPNPDAKMDQSAGAVRIDFEGLGSRVANLPLPQRDYAQMISGQPGKLNLVIAEWSKAPGDLSQPQQTQAVYFYDVAKGEEPVKVVDEIDAVDLTRDGRRILYRRGRDFFIVGAETAAKAGDGQQNFNKMEVRVTPAEEWKQMFHESMRIMRDWFYDPNHHGQDLAQLEQTYAAYLPTITRRADLNRLMGQMLGSVSVSHLGVGGGDAPPPPGGGSRIGLLGADYEIADGHYRFKKIYRSTSFAAANGAFTAPLDQPGVDIVEGDYLLEVNGQKVDAGRNLLTYFENTAGRPVRITVSRNVAGTNPRTSTVYPTNGENRLRRANWAEANRQLVERLSGGRLGYIYIEGYGGDGILNAVRGLTGYAGKAGIIVDQRYNGGGITPDYLIEWMARKPLYYYMFRGGDDIATPVNPAPPVKVLLINELNGSAAETGAFMFKLGKLGPVVGKRTFGGGIGPYFFTPQLVDNGRIQLPNRAAYDPSGTSWGIENIGVAPDFDVEITPQDVIAGRDPQLEKAVQVALAQVAKTPVTQPKRPPFPVHPGRLSGGPTNTVLPVPGSAFPITEVVTVTNGKFADFIGRFDTPMGIVSFAQEGDKLIGDAGGERIELTLDATVKDRFTGGPVVITFERDSAGKIIGATLVLPNGREIKGRKMNP